jgi:hypothetical protein
MSKKISWLVLILLFFTTACDGGLLPEITTPPPSIGAPVPQSGSGILEVAYIDSGDGEIHTWTQENGSKPITGEGGVQGVRISGDGKYIAFVGSDGGLYFLEPGVDTQEANVLITPDYLSGLMASSGTPPKITQFDFIPGKPIIMLNIKVAEGNGGLDLYEVSVDDSSPRPVRVNAPGQGGQTFFSPNGDWFVLTLPNELLLSSTNNTNPVALFNDLPPYLGIGGREGSDIVWESDSSSFYTVMPTYKDNKLYGTSTVWQVSVPNTTGSAPKPVTDSKFEFVAQLFHPVYISPRGTNVVYLVDYGDLVDYRIANKEGFSTFITYQKDKIGFLGWIPAPKTSKEDSKCFGYWQEHPEWPLLACQGVPAGNLTNKQLLSSQYLQWVDENRFLYISTDSILIFKVRDTNTEIDVGPIITSSNLPVFDFTHP